MPGICTQLYNLVMSAIRMRSKSTRNQPTTDNGYGTPHIFQRFSVHSDEPTVGTQWERWFTCFENLLAAMNITNGIRKKSTLSHKANEEVV